MRARLGFVVSAIGLAVGACQPKAPQSPSPPAPPDGEQFCAGWVLRDMLPVCQTPLTPEQASHRGKYVIVTRTGGKVVRVAYRNGAGGVSPDDDGDAGFTVRPGTGGATFGWVDAWGTPTMEWRITGLALQRVKPWGAPARDHADEAYNALYTLDSRGFVASVRFVDEAGRPAVRRGLYEQRWVGDEDGYAVETSYFGPAGEPAANPSGTHRSVHRHDKLGCQLSWENFDTAGRPFGGAMGVARGVRTCDVWGNPLTMRWSDGAGRAAINAQGIHGWDDTLDAHGGQASRVTLGLDGRPAPTNGQESMVRYRRDARGYVVEKTFHGPRGEPFVLANGSSGEHHALGAHGEITSGTHVDANGRPVKVRQGYATWENTYDAAGAIVSVRYRDTTGGPGTGVDGVPLVTYEHDERHLTRSATFRDAQGRVVEARAGYAEVRYRRDAEGRIVGRTHFGADGTPALVPGARTMWFTYAGAEVQRPTSLPRDEAQKRANEALARLRAHEPWDTVSRLLTGSGGDKEPTYGGKNYWYVPLWDAIVALRLGDPPVLVDTPRGYIIVERKE